MKKTILAAMICGLVFAPALAAIKDPSQIDQRNGAPVLSPLVGPYCSEPGLAIPDNVPHEAAASDTISVTDSESITDLDVVVNITHTWIGDVRVRLAHMGGCSGWMVHRPGITGDVCCGCSGDDINVTLDQAAADFVENSCGSGDNGGAGGSWKPSGEAGFPGDLDDCNGDDIAGDWTLEVSDGAAGDTGTLDSWCLIVNGDMGGDGGDGGVPATSTWGVMLLIALFLGVSLFYLRRRSTAGA